MRDLIMLALVLAALPKACKHTWVAVLLWTWVSIMNPHKLAWGFAQDAPFAAMAAGAALISLFVTKDKLQMPASPAVVALVMLVAWMCVTTVFGFDPEGSWEDLKRVMKIQLMTLIALAALRERKHIELFIWVNVLSIGFYGLKGGIFTILSGGSQRVWGPPGGFIEGNNEIGLALVMVIPFMNYLRAVSTHRWVRQGLLALMLLSAVAALGTQSRGAFLAVSAMGVVMWMRSQKKMMSAVLIGAAAVALVAFMPASWEERMSTIGEYEQDGSAMGRINAWWMAFNLANRHPLGGGFQIYNLETFGKFAPIPTDVHAAHSIYFQILGEHGYLGLLLFLLIGFFSFLTAGRIRKESRNRPDAQWAFHMAGMAQVSMVGYAVGGAFLSLAYFDLPYNIMVMLIVSLRWLREGALAKDGKGAFGSAGPTADLRIDNRSRRSPS